MIGFYNNNVWDFIFQGQDGGLEAGVRRGAMVAVGEDYVAE